MRCDECMHSYQGRSRVQALADSPEQTFPWTGADQDASLMVDRPFYLAPRYLRGGAAVIVGIKRLAVAEEVGARGRRARECVDQRERRLLPLAGVLSPLYS